MRSRTFRSPTRDRGASAAEYAGLIVLAALILGTLYATGVVDTIGDRTGQAICRILDNGGCATSQPPRAGGNGGPTPGLLPTAPPTVPPGATEPPTPSPGPSPSPAPDPSEQARKRTEKILNETPLGRDALSWIKQHGVQVVYRPGGGSYYSDDDNVFYVDTNQPPEEVAAVFVHETNHARNRYKPDVHKLSRADFIDQALDEEAHGTVLQIQENEQLQAKRGKDHVPDTILQNEYDTAYDDAVAAAGGNLTAAQKRQIGERAGEARVKQAFEDGEVVQSTDGRKYTDAYGEEWDNAHKHDGCFLWIFC